ncbi:MAG: hypothetical protein V4669_15235 [Pseudomonadota bacterium]
MNLVVATRHTGPHMRFDVEGRWQNGDALKLAYMIKAAAARLKLDSVIIDLRRVVTPPNAQGKFLICDRLRRALTMNTRVGVVALPELVDCEAPTLEQCPDVARFDAEADALHWLERQKVLH